MVFDILERERPLSDSFGSLILFYCLIRLCFIKYLVSPYWFINFANSLVDLKDPITLRVHVLYFSSYYLIKNCFPFIDILLIVRGSGKQCHIVDDVISFKLVEGFQAAFNNLGAEGEANHRNSLRAKGVAKCKRYPD